MTLKLVGRSYVHILSAEGSIDASQKAFESVKQVRGIP